MGKIVEVLMRNGNRPSSIVTAYLYTEEEFIEKFPNKRYAHYNIIYNTPAWYFHDFKGLVTEDGYVIEIIRLYYNDAGRIIKIKIPIGTIHARQWLKITSNSIPIGRKTFKSNILKPIEAKFIKKLYDDLDVADSYMLASGNFNMSAKKAYNQGMKLLKRERVRNRMRKEIIESADRQGVSVDYLIAKWKEKIESENEKVSLDALKEVSEIFELKEIRSKTSTSFNFKIPLNPGDIQALEGGQKKLGDGNLVEYEEVVEDGADSRAEG